MKKIWLITGSAHGLGRSIALTVLERGDSLVATARNIEQLDDLKEKYGSRIVIAKLDVTRPKEAQHAINTAIESF